jgi:DNA-binding Xre family transcriptional regulator
MYNTLKTIGGVTVITFDKLWETMRQKGVSQYRLIKEYKISAGQIGRLKKNTHCSTRTLNRLREILDCNISDIVEYKQ